MGQLFNSYIPDRKVFRCSSDAGVTDANNLGFYQATATVANSSFTTARCSYGYDDNHTSNDPIGRLPSQRISLAAQVVQPHFQTTTLQKGKTCCTLMDMWNGKVPLLVVIMIGTLAIR